MNVFSQAKGIIKAKAHESRVFIELEKLFDEVSSFEALITQAKGRKDQAEKEAKDTVANTEKLKQKAEKLVAKAKADAEAIVADAQAQADAIKAQAEASQANAVKSFQELMEGQDAVLKAKEVEVGAVLADLVKAQAALDQKQTEVAAAEEKLAQVQAQLAQLKNTL